MSKVLSHNRILVLQDPVKVKPWKNVLDCTSEKNGCLQFALRKRAVMGSEDCLYHNIHTPHVGRNLQGNKLFYIVQLKMAHALIPCQNDPNLPTGLPILLKKLLRVKNAKI